MLAIKRKFKYNGKTYRYNIKLREYNGYFYNGITLECNVRIGWDLFKTTLDIKRYREDFFTSITREEFLEEIEQMTNDEIAFLAEYEIKKEIDIRNREKRKLDKYNKSMSNINKKLRGR